MGIIDIKEKEQGERGVRRTAKFTFFEIGLVKS
jgi:hypothetical protein